MAAEPVISYMIEGASYNSPCWKDNAVAQGCIFRTITYMFVYDRDMNKAEVTSLRLRLIEKNFSAAKLRFWSVHASFGVIRFHIDRI